jgi:hypothetical protein
MVSMAFMAPGALVAALTGLGAGLGAGGREGERRGGDDGEHTDTAAGHGGSLPARLRCREP